MQAVKKTLLICTLFFGARTLVWSKPTKVAAFDVGSSTTKVAVYEVDFDLQVFTQPKALFKGSLDVPYEKTMVNQSLSEKTLKEGLTAIQTLSKQAREAGAEFFAGVLTGPFRKASNAKTAALHLSRETKIPFQIISQIRESELGFLAASTKVDSNIDFTVIDVGGSTFQITSRVNKSLTRAMSTKSTVAAQQFGANFHTPMLLTEFESLINEIKTWPQGEVPPGNRKFVGIGSYFSKGLMPDYGEKITATRLRAEAKRLYTKYKGFPTDAQLKSEFPKDTHFYSQRLYNLALAIALLEKYKINSIQVLDVNLAEGVALDRSFFNLKKHN